MSRYKRKNYSNRREYLDWLAERYGVDRADVVLLSSILGPTRTLTASRPHWPTCPPPSTPRGRFSPRIVPNEQNSPQIEGSFQ